MSDVTNAAMNLAPTARTTVDPDSVEQVAGGSASTGYTSQWATFTAQGGDCWILFGPTSSLACTTSTGWWLPENTTVSYFVGPSSAWVTNSNDSTGDLLFYVSG